MKASITRIRLYDCGIGCVNPGVSGKTTHGTRIANVLDVIRIAAEWRKRGIIQIQIEDDEGRSYDPQTFEKIHAHRRGAGGRQGRPG